MAVTPSSFTLSSVPQHAYTGPLRPGIRPSRLRQGDRVAVIAPSGPVEPHRLDAGCALLRGFGLEVQTGAHIRDRSDFLAGRDGDRAADLQAAWCDPAVRAVICARGGYGAARVLDRLDWEALAAVPPSLLHGSSDATALHAAFHARLGTATTFGPMVAGDLLAADEPETASITALWETMFAPERAQSIAAPQPRVLAGGRASGVLTGGNLSVLAASMGTRHAALPSAGGIVLLEDVTEAPYRIDRMLTQLRQAGYFEGAAGIVLGSWRDCGPPEEVERVLLERLGPLDLPMIAGLPVGHGSPQLTLPLGIRANLDADAGTVTFDEPALAIP